MRKVQIGGNRYKHSPIKGWALVDNEDYFFCTWYAWSMTKNGYACVKERSGKLLYMHHLVKKPPKGKFIDHINGNKLDNRKKNLRVATKAQNGMNRGKPSSNTSGYKGVYKCSSTGKWRVEIRSNGKKYRLGRFDDIIKAAEAYNMAAKKLHGNFAKLNATGVE